MAYRLLAVLFLVAGPVAAATITVTTPVDELNADGDCSLREAIRSANLDLVVDECAGGSGPDIIVFGPGVVPGIFAITIPGPGEDAALTGDLDIAGDLLIQGSGATGTIIDGGGLDRVFDITGTGVNAEFVGLTIRNGDTPSSGGAIFGSGNSTITVRECVISGNNAGTNGGGLGGGDDMFISDSTFADNSANQFGGALHDYDAITVSIMRTAFVRNSASIGGAVSISETAGTITDSTFVQNYGVNAGAAIRSDYQLDVFGTTIARNEADFGSPAIFNTGPPGSVRLRNDVFSENTGYFVGDDDCVDNGISLGHNLFSAIDPACMPLQMTDLINVAAGLGALEDDGSAAGAYVGPTFFSPVVDAGDDADCSPIDQLGRSHHVDGNQDGNPACDMGAVELRPLVVTKTADTLDGACDADCSLREAVREANARPGADVIVVPQGIFGLTLTGTDDDSEQGDLDIHGDVEIVGARRARTIVDAGGIDRNFDVHDGTLTLRRVTVRNGNGTHGGGVAVGLAGLVLDDVSIESNFAVRGGGIWNAGTVVGSDCAIVGNAVGLEGGGLLSLTGDVSLTDCVVAQNVSPGNGGGLLLQNAAGSYVAELQGCSVEDNTADLDGGGIHTVVGLHVDQSALTGNSAGGVGGAVFAGADVQVRRSTFTENYALDGGGLFVEVGGQLYESTLVNNTASYDGGGVFSVDTSVETLLLRSTILSGNVTEAGPGNPECLGDVESQGFNLFGNLSNCFIINPQPTDLYGPPGTAPVLYSSVPGETHLPLIATSLALEQGIRFFARDQLGHLSSDHDFDGQEDADIGSIERIPIRARVQPSIVDPATQSTVAACIHIDMNDSPFQLGSYGATLTWDTEQLQYYNATGGAAPFDYPLINEDGVGFGTLSFADAQPAGAAGDVWVACAQFSVVGAVGSTATIDLELSSVFAAATFIDLRSGSAAEGAVIHVVPSCDVGNVNGDFVRNSGDALLLLAYEILLPIPFPVMDFIDARCGDATGDDVTDSADATAILSLEIGLIDELPNDGPNQSYDRCPDDCVVVEAKSQAVSPVAPARWVEIERDAKHGTHDFALIVEPSDANVRLGSYGVVLEWDSRRLELVEVTRGRNGFAAPLTNLAEAAQGRLRAAAVTPRGVEGAVELLRVRFRAQERRIVDAEREIDVRFTSLRTPAPDFRDLLPNSRSAAEGCSSRER